MPPTKNVITWLIGDARYDIDLFDIDGIEWRDAKRASGMQQGQLLALAVVEKDLEALAAILWIWRRRKEPKLEYEDVLKGLSFGVLGSDDTAAEEGAADPPG